MSISTTRQAGRYSIYIAGPIGNDPDRARPVFAAAERYLSGCGHEPVNPFTLHGCSPELLTRATVMRSDLRALMECEAIYLLPGWMDSQGARCEHDVAVQIGLIRMWPCAEDVADMLSAA